VPKVAAARPLARLAARLFTAGRTG
jgi:hypothetical protein